MIPTEEDNVNSNKDDNDDDNNTPLEQQPTMIKEYNQLNVITKSSIISMDYSQY